MTSRFCVSAVALAVATGWALPAAAQAAGDAAVLRELAQMRAQMTQMAQRIDTLEGQLAAAQARADAASAAAAAATSAAANATAVASAAAAVPAPSVTAKPDTQIAWDGGPKLVGKDGWSFKPRGRLQLDVAGVDAPKGIVPGKSLGVATEFRRAYIGFDGTMPGGFGYRIEVDLANSAVDLTDIYLTWKANTDLTLTVGQHKPFFGMEDLQSDLFLSFLERAAFTNAFGFERRVGASATYNRGALLVQGGVFSDNSKDLIDSNNSFSLDGRVVFMPKLAGGTLHLGGSAHYRQFNDLTHVGSYSVRPFSHATDLRLVNTGNVMAVSGERVLGAELAYVRGRFHAAAESSWLTAKRDGLANPTFNGGYAEAGLLLTDDTTAYKGGVFDRIRPKTPLGRGGIGAVQVNARYDWLDLSDAGIVGGRQQIAGLSALWIPTDNVRFIVNYGHIWLKDAALPAGADRTYSADSLGMRAQFDF